MSDIPMVRPGTPLPESLPESRYKLWSEPAIPGTSPINLVRAESCDQAYGRLLALFDGLSKDAVVPNVICQVGVPAATLSLPAAYPQVDGITMAERDAWFEDLVKWWQRKQSSLRAPQNFNHGSRIQAFDSGGDDPINQLDRVVTVLSDKWDSSRAMVSLFDPRIDNIATKERFPSFCFVQFMIRDVGGRRVLDCIGFFRKQEVRYWWPINLAELVKMQQDVLEGVKRSHPNIELGSVTTFATAAIVGNSPPRVAVPEVDRLFDENRDELWSMVYALFWKDMPERSKWDARWRDVLNNLIPGDDPAPDGDPVSIDGVGYLQEQVKKFALHHRASGDADLLMRRLDELATCNSAYDEALAKNDKIDKGTHARWRHKVVALVDEIRKLVEKMIAA